MSTTARPYGWEVTVRFHPASGKATQTFHYRGCTERDARLKGMLKGNAQAIEKIEPVHTQEQWERAYGIPQRM